jgi:hypothetical protein
MRALVFISLAAALVGAGEATTLNSSATKTTVRYPSLAQTPVPSSSFKK